MAGRNDNFGESWRQSARSSPGLAGRNLATAGSQVGHVSVNPELKKGYLAWRANWSPGEPVILELL
ncbi:hypothetical protein A2U01_0081727 [Trifolium medium]|uniref:Uncharacterized protein n=1 Tax=Trifolium medium TaxID=97028 RepID=A0A392TH58_9FABA|nr:hypothetical protein [Trifolium medium]